MKHRIAIVFYVLLLLQSKAQNLDSLWGVWQDKTQADTIRLNAIQLYTKKGFLYTKPDSAFFFADLQYEFAKQKGLKKQMADAINTKGISLWIQGDYVRAIDYFTRCLVIQEDIGDVEGIASALNNIGLIYGNQGDYVQALEYFFKSLKIKEKIGKKQGIANSLNNIGVIYEKQGDYTQSIEFYTRSLKKREEIGDKQGVAMSLNNIGNIYGHKGDSANNAGNVALASSHYANALKFHAHGLKLKEEIGDKQGVSVSLVNMGKIYFNQNQHSKAIEFCVKSLQLAKEIGAIIETQNSAKSLYEIYRKAGKYQQALEMHELYIQMRDSVLSEENKKEIIRQEYKYEYEKKEVLVAAEQEKKDILAKEALKKQTLQRNGFIVGFIFMLVLAGVIFRSYRNKRKDNLIITQQKQEVEKQKALIEQKQKEILDSIRYAKRIQDCMLPKEKIMHRNVSKLKENN